MKGLSLLIVCVLPGVAFSCSCDLPVSRKQTIKDFFCSEYSRPDVYTARVVGATCNCIPASGDANLQCQDYTFATGSMSVVNVEVVNRIPESACSDGIAMCSRLTTSLLGSGITVQNVTTNLPPVGSTTNSCTFLYSCPFNNNLDDNSLIIRQPCVYTVEVIMVFKGNFVRGETLVVRGPDVLSSCGAPGRVLRLQEEYVVGIGGFCSPIGEWSTVSSYSSSELNLLTELASGCPTKATIGEDPHFSIVLQSGKLLCYTVQGEHGFVFNLISNKMFHMNAMFVPDSRREEVTWLGSMGIIVQNSQYKMSSATYLRFETRGKKIYVGDKVTLEAKNVEKLTFNQGKMTISEAAPFEDFQYPSVLVDLQDMGFSFTIKFMREHLDLFWHSTGKNIKDSHGIIGQFFRKGVEIDETRKILILPGKEPVPVMRHPVWSFMEREVGDDQLCWTAMNPGYQGEGLIDGTYFDYLVNDVFSTDFKLMKQQ